jgi:3',5'-cyclic AMP phosphodiesterase CpdA
VRLEKWKSILEFKKVFNFLVMLCTVFSLLLPAGWCMAADDNAGNILPDEIILSWTVNPETTQTIAWRTSDDIIGDQAQYMPAAVAKADFTGAQEVSAVRSDLYPGYFHYEVTLQGLTPGAGYVYRVGREGAWSAPASFTTSSAADKFSFIYMGDVQQGYGEWGNMLQVAVAEEPGPKFALLGGDLVDDSNSVEWQQFFNAAAPVFKQIPLMPAAGNHDDTPLFWNSFALPQNGPEGLEEKFYSFDYGNCHIVVLNSNYLGNPAAADFGKVSAWLRNDLDNSCKQWKFAVLHYPPYPAAPDGHAANLQENWVPLLEQGQVDAVFDGHQHIYMRTKPLRNNQVQADGQGIVYIMGNAGNKFCDPGPNYDYIAEEIANVSNYEVVSINGNTFSLTAKNAGGQEIDSYTFEKQTDADDACYTVTPIADTDYQNGKTADGIGAMTVNSGIYSLKYFGARVAPVRTHKGSEAVVFVHSRNGVRQSLNVTKADFDAVNTARAGFNVQPGDIIKVYIVDDLNNLVDFNPTILQ